MAFSSPARRAPGRVLIIGAGIVGNSLAFHLTRLGVGEVTLLEKGPLPRPGGSTGHASNFIFPVDHTRALTQLIADSMAQYAELGVSTTSGGIEVARTEARLQELERRIDSGTSYGVAPLRMVTPAEIGQLIPFAVTDELLGGLHCPTAVVVDSVRAATLMRERAIAAGATVRDGVEILDLTVHEGRIAGVVTDREEIAADTVVIACGAWSPRVARMAGVRLPLTPMIHQMIELGPVPRFADARALIEWPILRDMDCGMYEHQKWDGLHVGSYAHRPIALAPETIPSIAQARLSPTEMEFTAEDFAPQMAIARALVPEMCDDPAIPVRYAINGVLSVTHDGMPLLGEVPQVSGLWSAAAVWVREGPAVGRALAEWMVHGDSELDLHTCDVARVHARQSTRAHVVARAGEAFNKMYGIVHPAEQWASDRGARLSPLHDRELALGASFTETAGWERPHWYESNRPLLERYAGRVRDREAEWDGRWWSPIILAEHLAMREHAALFDLTPFCVFEITGPGALAVVQHVAMRQMDVAVGRIVYTPILTPGGGFRADLTITRLAHDVFRVVSGAAHGPADIKWFADTLPADGSAQLRDLTSATATLGLWGPRARDILASLSDDDVSDAGLAFGRCADIDVGSLPVLASRLSYVGELGWELTVEAEDAPALWDLLMAAGAPHGLIPAGVGVYNTTGRIEKGYRAYGAELLADYTVVEAGMAWGRVKDEPFVGREAHLAHRAAQPDAILCTLTVTDPVDARGVHRAMLGHQPILTPDGEPLVDARGRTSYVTSAGSAPSLGAYLLMAYLPPAHARIGTELHVRYLGERYPVEVAAVDATPLFDPDNERVRR